MENSILEQSYSTYCEDKQYKNSPTMNSFAVIVNKHINGNSWYVHDLCRNCRITGCIRKIMNNLPIWPT